MLSTHACQTDESPTANISNLPADLAPPVASDAFDVPERANSNNGHIITSDAFGSTEPTALDGLPGSGQVVSLASVAPMIPDLQEHH